MPDSIISNSNITLEKPADPQRDAYTFEGWYDKAVPSATDQPFDFASGANVTDALVLYAKWVPVPYALTLDNEGVDAESGEAIPDSSSAITPGNNPETYTIEDAIVISNPTRVGYAFAGWDVLTDVTSGSITSADGGMKVTINKGSAGDVSLQARWSANSYRIDFSGNGGQGAASPASVSLQVTDTDKRFAAAGTLGSTAARTGYHFGGWNSKADGTGTRYAARGAIDPAAFIGASEWVYDSGSNAYVTTLYAKWDENTYDIGFDAGGLDGVNARIGGTAPEELLGLKYTDKVTFPAAGFTQQGYTFTAWDTVAGTPGGNSAGLWAPTGGAAPSVTVADIVASAKTQAITNDASDNAITLVANWNANRYSVAYGKGDVTDEVDLPASISGETYTDLLGKGISAPLPNTLGYISSCWNVTNDKDGGKSGTLTEAATIGPDTFTRFFNGSAGDETVTLTGSWIEKRVTVRYDKNAAGAAYTSADGQPVSATLKYTDAIALPVDVAGDGAGKAAAGIEYAGYDLDGWKAASDAAGMISASKASDVVAAHVSAAGDAAAVAATAAPSVTVYAAYGAGENSYTVVYSYQSIGDGTYPDNLKVAEAHSDVATDDKVTIGDAKGRHMYNGSTYVIEESGSQLGDHTVSGDPSRNVWTVRYKLVLTVNYENSDPSKGGWEDDSGEAAASAEFDWGDALALPEARSSNNAAYRFAGWDPSEGAPAPAPDAKVVRDGDTYTAAWEYVMYKVSYGYYGATTEKLAGLPTAKAYRWTQLASLKCGYPSVKVGADFVDWRTGADGAESISGDALVRDVLFNSGAGSADGRDMEGTLYLNAKGRSYTVNFWMFNSISGNPVLGADGQPISKEVTFGGGAIDMPRQDDIHDDSKLYGYMVAGFKAGSLNKALSPASGDPVALSADELISALGVRADGGTYNLFAKWNAVYKVDVPTSRITMSIDATKQEEIASDKEVSVRNASPKQVCVGAYSEISDDDMAKAKYLFLGNKDAGDAALAGIEFTFVDAAKPFQVNGGTSSAVAYTSPLDGVEVQNGKVTRYSSMEGKVRLAVPDSVWPSLAAATGRLLSMPEADFAALGLDIARDLEQQQVSWGKIATITWVIGSAADGDTWDAATGQGANEYGPFATEADAYN